MTPIERATQAALASEVRSATVYVSPTFRVTATRPHRGTKRDRSTTLVVTIGKPNYRQRLFVRLCQKAKVAFPIRKPQLTFWKAK